MLRHLFRFLLSTEFKSYMRTEKGQFRKFRDTKWKKTEKSDTLLLYSYFILFKYLVDLVPDAAAVQHHPVLRVHPLNKTQRQCQLLYLQEVMTHFYCNLLYKTEYGVQG